MTELSSRLWNTEDTLPISLMTGGFLLNHGSQGDGLIKVRFWFFIWAHISLVILDSKLSRNRAVTRSGSPKKSHRYRGRNTPQTGGSGSPFGIFSTNSYFSLQIGGLQIAV